MMVELVNQHKYIGRLHVAGFCWNNMAIPSIFFYHIEIQKCDRSSDMTEMLMQGFVISDWEGLDRLSEPHGSNYRQCISLAVNAGIDMVKID